MESDATTSQEKLERMLRDGRITEEVFLRLSRAMENSMSRREAAIGADAERRTLHKDGAHGVIGGLCAGYAAYLGVDVRVVRAVLIVGLLLLSAAFGFGLALIPLYFLLCASTPWGDEKSRKFAASGHPRLLMSAAACLFVVFPLLYSVLIVPGLESRCSSMGIDVWSVAFQSTIAGRAFDCASEYRGYLRELCSFHFTHQMIILLLCSLAILATLFVGLVYRNLCSAKLRRQFTIVIIGLGWAWLVFLVAGTLYPLITLAKAVQ